MQDYLLQLDLLRQECERTGQFLKAQECVNRMREVNLRYAKKVELRSHNANVVSRRRATEDHKLELLTFTRMWEEKLREYDQKADLIVFDLKKSHAESYRQQEAELRLQIMNLRPRFSSKVMELRQLLEKFVGQRRYVEAEDAKNKLAVLEQQELAAFDDSLSQRFDRRAQQLKKSFVAELRAAEQKISVGREELLAQRESDFQRLMKAHDNTVREIDQQAKLHIAKTKHYIHGQVKALVLDPVKTTIDIGGVQMTVREGQGRASTPRRATTGQRMNGSSGFGAMRARTPPATSSSALRRTQRTLF